MEIDFFSHSSLEMVVQDEDADSYIWVAPAHGSLIAIFSV